MVKKVFNKWKFSIYWNFQSKIFAKRLVTDSPELQKQQPEVFCKKKDVLRNLAKFTGKHLCQSLFIKKETLLQALSYEICEISINICFTKHPRTTASRTLKQIFRPCKSRLKTFLRCALLNFVVLNFWLANRQSFKSISLVIWC